MHISHVREKYCLRTDLKCILANIQDFQRTWKQTNTHTYTHTHTYTQTHTKEENYCMHFNWAVFIDHYIFCSVQVIFKPVLHYTYKDSCFHWGLFVYFLLSWYPRYKQSVSRGLICMDSVGCCHTELEIADLTCYFVKSQSTHTGSTSPSTAWHLAWYPLDWWHVCP